MPGTWDRSIRKQNKHPSLSGAYVPGKNKITNFTSKFTVKLEENFCGNKKKLSWFSKGDGSMGAEDSYNVK